MTYRRIIQGSDFELPLWRRLTLSQRYLYLGCTVHADCDGILPIYHLDRIIFGTDGISKDQQETELQALEREKLIYRYQESSDVYIQVLKWWDKQFIDKKMYKPSAFPKSEFYRERPENLERGYRKSYYDVSGKPLVINKENPRRPLEQYKSIESKQKQSIPNKPEYSPIRGRLVKWLSSFEKVTDPKGLADWYIRKYGDRIIIKAINDTACSSLSQFRILCDHYSSKNEHN